MAEWSSYQYEGTSGERCDVAITLHLREFPEFKELSRARVQALINAGGVLLEGKHVSRVQKNLRPGMQLEIDLELLRELLNPPAPEHIVPVDMPLEVLHVDEHLAVVVKPVGMSVHPSATETGPTLAAVLIHHLGQLPSELGIGGIAGLSDEGGADRPGIVHRLDKDTSGVLVVARNNPAHISLSRQFADRLTEKEYAALVLDPPPRQQAVIVLPIERHPRNRQRMWTGGRGREAQSEYRIAETWGPLSLLDVSIHTGRTHQIRVHLLSEGCCILNDDKYGSGRNGSFRKFLRDGSDTGARRVWKQSMPEHEPRRALLKLLEGYAGIFLHAKRLAFRHPVSGEQLEFTAPLPDIWGEVRELSAAE